MSTMIEILIYMNINFISLVAYWFSMSYINLCFMSCRFTFDVAFWNGVFVLIPFMYVTRL